MTALAETPVARPARFPLIDVVRGVAILGMAGYHFSWDLFYFGLVDWPVDSALGWMVYARVVASTFLLLVGVSFVMASRQGFAPRRFLRRLAILAVAAALVTLATAWFLPDQYIFFGILHCIAVSSVLALAFRDRPLPLLLVTAVAFAAIGSLVRAPVFDAWPLRWVGLGTVAPDSVDYIPIFPWFAPVLFGMLLGRWLLRRHDRALFAWQPSGPVTRGLRWAGRWSLLIYLLHQPLLLGVLYLAALATGTASQAWSTSFGQTDQERAFRTECRASCAAAGAAAEACATFCDCAVEQSQAQGLWDDMLYGTATQEARAELDTLIGQCRQAAVPGR